MDVIKPITILDKMVIGSTISEDDYSVWDETINYTRGQKAVVLTNEKTGSVSSDYMDYFRACFASPQSAVFDGAFFWAVGVDLSDYVGTDRGYTPYTIELTDKNGYKAKGYIAGSGTGKNTSPVDYSSPYIQQEECSNSIIEGSSWQPSDGSWYLWNHRANAINGMEIEAVEMRSQGLFDGALYLSSITMTYRYANGDLLTPISPSSGSIAYYYGETTNVGKSRPYTSTLNVAMTEYANSTVTTPKLSPVWGVTGAGTFAGAVTSASLKAIKDPPRADYGGVHIVSQRNGTYRAWESVDPEFSYMEIASYHIYCETVVYHKIYECLDANQGKFPPFFLYGQSPVYYWEALQSTVSWRAFDGKIQDSATATDEISYALSPGSLDSIAFFNMDADVINIKQIDADASLLTVDWSGASGSTPPTGWTAVGTATFSVSINGVLSITAGTSPAGISKTFSVTPLADYLLVGGYLNASDDVAQYSIYDNSHGEYIVSRTDLDSFTISNGLIYYPLTIPYGCISITIELLAKSSGDVVYFDKAYFAPILCAITIDSADETEAVTFNLLKGYLSCVVTIAATKTGTVNCGEIVCGLSHHFGKTSSDPKVGIIDYSIKEADTFGYYLVTERAYSSRASSTVFLQNKDVDGIYNVLAVYRATPLVWVGHSSYSSMILYGYYKDFTFILHSPGWSDLNLSIEGLT